MQYFTVQTFKQLHIISFKCDGTLLTIMHISEALKRIQLPVAFKLMLNILQAIKHFEILFVEREKALDHSFPLVPVRLLPGITVALICSESRAVTFAHLFMGIHFTIQLNIFQLYMQSGMYGRKNGFAMLKSTSETNYPSLEFQERRLQHIIFRRFFLIQVKMEV